LTAQFKPGPDLRLSNSITSLWGNVAINASNAQTYAASSRPPRIFLCRPTLTKAKNELTTTATQNVNGQQPASSGVETGSMQATANRQR